MQRIITFITVVFLTIVGYSFTAYGQTPLDLEISSYQPEAKAIRKITIKSGFSVPAGQQFVGEIVPPDMPPVPTITYNCGSTILTAATPPAGITYYFQTSETGENTSDTSPYTVTVSNTYFLRSRTDAGSWGAARPITVTVNPIPADPTGPPVITSNGEDVAVLTAPAAPSGFTYYFQMSANGKDTFRQSPFTVTESGTYYLRARHNLSDCWSTGVTSVVVTIVASDPIALDPDEARNYITENTVLVPGKLTVSDLQNLTIQNLSQQTTFFDGLGRPIQSVNTQASPTRKDMVMPMDYDQYGRPNRAYLPFTQGEDGKFKPNAIKDAAGNYAGSNQFDFYQNTPDIAHDIRPFAKTVYDNSPLDFALGQGSVGKVWNPTEEQGDGKIVTSTYRTNTTGDEVRWLVYNHTGDGSIGTFSSHSTTPNYPVGRLMVSEMKDEDNNTVLQFTNKSGQVIMKRALLTTTDYLDTYYIYDDFGLLRYVLPPKLVEIMQANNWQASASELNQYVYHYTYDTRKRLVEKKVPGASVVYLIYNRRDELILSQDGNQRAGNDNRWTFTKYDILGRPVITGEYNAGIDTKATLQTAANAHVLQHETHTTTALPYYTDQAYPTLSGKTHQINTITYYDDYDFDNNGSGDRDYNDNFQDQFTETPSQKKPNPVYGHDGKLIGTRGLVTGTYTRNADFGGLEEQWLKTVIFYDDRERPVQVQADNHIGGLDITTTQYHFDGRVVKSYLRHQTTLDATRPQVAVSQWEDYDHARRVTASYQQIDNEPVERMAVYTYNELSQLTSKKVGHTTRAGSTTSYLQKIDFSYTIRGWLSKINNTALDATGENDQFGMELSYNQSGTTATSYNGNITGYSWKSATDGVARTYSYKYDALGRLLKANFTGAPGEDFSLYGNSADGEGNISYDKNGNILTLHRKGLISYGTTQNPVYGIIDELRYNYQDRGNQLLFVDDDAPANTGLAGDFQDGNEYSQNPLAEYSFDANGNQLKDDNKKITGITYNYLDLPELIQYEGGNQIEYFYDGAGSVLRKIVTMSGTTPKTIDYAGSFVYENNQLQLIHTPEGRALTPQLAQSNKFVYEYQYNDHQGNLRMLFREGNTIKYKATMETENAITEELQFDNVTTTRVTDVGMSCTPDESAKIDPDKNQTLGPWKTILVRRGDKIQAKAKALYTTPATNNRGLALLLYLNNLGSSYPATNSETGNSYPVLHAGIGINPTIPDGPQGKPKAYLKYMFYDAQGNYLPNPGNDYDAITSGPNDCLEQLEVNFTADRDGSIQVFVANESEVPVWFDDIEITHVQALTVQENHYDPFGLSLAGIEKTGSPDYKYQYNAMSEKQRDVIGKGYFYETEYRSYNPQIGRFIGIDVMATGMPAITPYHFAYNNPVMFNDPHGDIPLGIAIGAALGGGISAFLTAKDGGSIGEIAVAGITGMLAGGILGGMVDGIISMGAGSFGLPNMGPLLAKNSKFIIDNIEDKTIRILIHHGDKEADEGWGGRKGGHVMVNLGEDDVYGFTGGWSMKDSGEQKDPGIFPTKDRSKWYSRIHGSEYYGSFDDFKDGEVKGLTSVFEIKVNSDQYNSLKEWYESNVQPDGVWNKGPYDYSVFGKRCTSSAYNELKRSGIIKNNAPLNSFFNAFTPGSMFKYLYRNGYYVNTYVQKGGLSSTQINTVNYYNKTVKLNFKYRLYLR